MISLFQSALEDIKKAIIDNNGKKLEREFARAREIKLKAQSSKLKAQNLIIAIDGPAGSGKSTAAKILSKRFNYKYIDTGAMYRAVALKAIESNIPLSDERRVSEIAADIKIEFAPPLSSPPSEGGEGGGVNQKIFANGKDITLKIRDEDIGKGASVVSAYSGVRKVLLIKQREMGKSGGVVMEGRDIGTVIFPDAHIKFFLDASVEERGKRRYRELKEKGEDVRLDRIIEGIKDRDNNDVSRNLAPLKKSPDSIVIDTTGISIDEVIENMLQRIDKLMG
ncbi:MAG: (d)CMP kinase [Nitrospinae bacterium]|nr:(d)CMP kinase [Nitrospinota bacterium]